MQETNRPTKKQREILTFIDNFIVGHGFGPSYREVAAGLGYKSAATVSVHINNLIAKGLLEKRGKSRALFVVGDEAPDFKVNRVSESEEKWLVKQIDMKFSALESEPNVRQEDVDELYVLIGALTILDFQAAANSFRPRLASIKKKIK